MKPSSVRRIQALAPHQRAGAATYLMGGHKRGTHQRHGRDDWEHAPKVPMSDKTYQWLKLLTRRISAVGKTVTLEFVTAQYLESLMPSFRGISELTTGSDKRTHRVKIPMTTGTVTTFRSRATEVSHSGASVAPMQVAAMFLEATIARADMEVVAAQLRPSLT